MLLNRQFLDFDVPKIVKNQTDNFLTGQRLNFKSTRSKQNSGSGQGKGGRSFDRQQTKSVTNVRKGKDFEEILVIEEKTSTKLISVRLSLFCLTAVTFQTRDSSSKISVPRW